MGRTIGLAATAFLLGAYAFAARPGDPSDDPARPDPETYRRVEAALAQGRHWYAARLLRRLPDSDRHPETAALAARADAGRGAWSEVTRRLHGRPWLDSADGGASRALLARAWLESGYPERAARHYETFLDYSIRREARAFAEIGLGRALDDLDRHRDAAVAYDRAAALLPELEPFLAVRAAEGLASIGDTAGVRSRLDAAMRVPAAHRIEVTARARARARDSSGAVRLLLESAGSVAPSTSAAFRTRAARMLLERGDTVAARTALRLVVRTTPGDALEAAGLLSMLPGLGTVDHLRLARAYERSGAAGRAVPEYRRYLEATRPSQVERHRLRLRIGEILFRTGAYRAAIDELEALIPAAAPSIAVRAEYLIARSTYRLGYRSRGRVLLRRLADRHAGSGYAIRSLNLLADVYEGAGDMATANELYEEITRRYPWTGSAARARFRLGILAFIDGDYAEARRRFDRCRRGRPGRDLFVRSTYWAARARLAEGTPDRTAEAERLFRSVHARDPFGYYGLLSAERVGIDPWADLPAGPEPAPLDPAVQRDLEVIRTLQRAGMEAEAQLVLDEIVDSAPDRPADMLGLSFALADAGFGRQAVQLGWRAHARLRGRWSTNVLRAIYPFAYPDIIVAESEARQLDPYLLAAIARRESMFTADITSRAGARGLLQVMPATGRQLAGRLGVDGYSDELLYHPEINVHLGAFYFADLQRRYRELQLSLVAYNAGPSRARRWRSKPAYRIDPELFAERIPFRETRGYVRAVQTQVRIYRQLYGEAAPAGSNAAD